MNNVHYIKAGLQTKYFYSYYSIIQGVVRKAAWILNELTKKYMFTAYDSFLIQKWKKTILKNIVFRQTSPKTTDFRL